MKSYPCHATSWLFTSAEMEATPSITEDGLSQSNVRNFRRSQARLIRFMGNYCNLSTTTVNTAAVLMHRFYTVRSILCHDRVLTAMAFILIASKEEGSLELESSRLMELSWKPVNMFYGFLEFTDDEVMRMDLRCWEEWRDLFLVAEDQLKNTEEFSRLRFCVRLCQLDILYTLGFNTTVVHPHHFIESMESMLQAPPGMVRNLVTYAGRLATYGQETTLSCVRHPPLHTAMALLYLSATANNYSLDEVSVVGQATIPWYQVFDEQLKLQQVKDLADDFVTQCEDDWLVPPLFQPLAKVCHFRKWVRSKPWLVTSSHKMSPDTTASSSLSSTTISTNNSPTHTVSWPPTSTSSAKSSSPLSSLFLQPESPVSSLTTRQSTPEMIPPDSFSSLLLQHVSSVSSNTTTQHTPQTSEIIPPSSLQSASAPLSSNTIMRQSTPPPEIISPPLSPTMVISFSPNLSHDAAATCKQIWPTTIYFPPPQQPSPRSTASTISSPLTLPRSITASTISSPLTLPRSITASTISSPLTLPRSITASTISSPLTLPRSITASTISSPPTLQRSITPVTSRHTAPSTATVSPQRPLGGSSIQTFQGRCQRKRTMPVRIMKGNKRVC